MSRYVTIIFNSFTNLPMINRKEIKQEYIGMNGTYYYVEWEDGTVGKYPLTSIASITID